MTTILLFVLTILIIFIVYLLFQAVGGIIFGAKIEEIGLFNGPAIFKFKIGETTFRFNTIPLSSFVRFTDEFSTINPIKKILIVIFGLLSYFLIALICLGFSETFNHVFHGFAMIIRGAIFPFAEGSKLLESFFKLYTDQPFTVPLGISATKFLAFNLFPLGMLGGGNLIVNVLELVGFKSESFNEKFAIIGLIFILLIMIGWLIAFMSFIF